MFTALFDLRKFYQMLDKGLEFDVFHFFLIKKTGIHLLTRETDFVSSMGLEKEVNQAVVHAKGLDESSLDPGDPDVDTKWNAMRDKTGRITPSDICEWLCLSQELFDEVDDMIRDGFQQLEIKFKKVDVYPGIYDEQTVMALQSGEAVLDHNFNILTEGGQCPVTDMKIELELSYLNADTAQRLSDSYEGKPLHLNRSQAQTFEKWFGETYPDGLTS